MAFSPSLHSALFVETLSQGAPTEAVNTEAEARIHVYPIVPHDVQCFLVTKGFMCFVVDWEVIWGEGKIHGEYMFDINFPTHVLHFPAYVFRYNG